MNKLDIKNPNQILFKHGKLTFEVLGGINPENYHSLRIMLITGHERAKHRDNVDLLNPDQITNYIKKAAERTQLHREIIKEAFDELINQLEEYKLDLQNQKSKPVIKSYQLTDVERTQAIDTLKQPELLKTINGMMDKAGIIGNETNRLILFLTYLTRKTNSSLHAVIQSPYNYLQSKLGELIPEEEKVIISHISDNALFYFGEIELQNRVVLVEDTYTNRKKLLPLIGFQINGTVTKTTVTKNEHAELVTIQRQIKGNVSLSISTREEQAFTQNGALSFVLNEDTGSVQDEKVLLYQRKQSAGLIKPHSEQLVITQLQNLQRALAPITVINPYALDIQLPAEIKNRQITNLHYLRFIEVVTFLKQYQRTPKPDTETGELYIETTLEDIKEANQLLSEILVNKSDVLNKPTRLFLEQLKKHLAAFKPNDGAFTLCEVSTTLKVPKSSLVRYAKTLLEAGFIKATGKGNKKDGYLYELVNIEEYEQLKASVSAAMDSTLTNLQKSSEPQTTIDQKQSGTLKALTNKGKNKVNHNSAKGILPKQKKNNKNKGV